jgi:hypothetical protein
VWRGGVVFFLYGWLYGVRFSRVLRWHVLDDSAGGIGHDLLAGPGSGSFLRGFFWDGMVWYGMGWNGMGLDGMDLSAIIFLDCDFSARFFFLLYLEEFWDWGGDR